MWSTPHFFSVKTAYCQPRTIYMCVFVGMYIYVYVYKSRQDAPAHELGKRIREMCVGD